MSMDENEWIPSIALANYVPDPVQALRPFVMRVLIVDAFRGRQEDVRMAGELYSGEV